MRRLLAGLVLSSAVAVGASLLSAPQTAQASAGTFYVDCSAKAAGTGTSKSPWHSIKAVNAHGPFAPGTRILFRSGKTCSGTLTPTGSGTAGRPIVLDRWGSKGSLPTLQGKGSGDRTAVVMLTDQQYWTIQNLHVTNTSGGRTTKNYRSGVLVQNTQGGTLRGITIRKLRVEKVTSSMSSARADPRNWGGITVVTNSTKSGGFSGLSIMDNRVDHVGRTGIIVSNNTYPRGSDSGARVAGNTVSWTRGDGIVVRGSRKARIDHNVVAHASDQWPCSDCGPISPLTANAGVWTALSENVKIDHNEAYGTKAKGGDGEGFDIDINAVNTVFENNYSHDNEAGGLLLCGSRNATVRFNIFENNGRSAIAFIGTIPAKKTSIYNNTIYNSSASKSRPVRYFNGAHGSGITFKNNIVYNYGSASWLWPAKPKTAANTLIGMHGKGRPADAATSYRAPGLRSPGTGGIGRSSLSGYKPSKGVKVQTGVAIPKSVTRDFFGKRINPLRPPRGAAG